MQEREGGGDLEKYGGVGWTLFNISSHDIWFGFYLGWGEVSYPHDYVDFYIFIIYNFII